MTGPRRRLAIVMAAVALAGAGCTNQPGGITEEDFQAFCNAYFRAEQAVVAEFQDGPAEGEVEDLLVRAQETAPEQVREDVEAYTAAARQAVESGDPSSITDSPEVLASDEAVDVFTARECNYETHEVTGVEYAFQGVPETLPAGRIAFVFTVPADAEEFHEMVVFRIAEGVDESIEDLLQLPDEEIEGLVSIVERMNTGPGQSDTEAMELETGRHGVVCFVSVGQTTEHGEAEGEPHAFRGMFGEFSVEEAA